jgi:hypothetical protein
VGTPGHSVIWAGLLVWRARLRAKPARDLARRAGVAVVIQNVNGRLDRRPVRASKLVARDGTCIAQDVLGRLNLNHPLTQTPGSEGLPLQHLPNTQPRPVGTGLRVCPETI